MHRIGVLFLTNWVPVGGFETHLLSILRTMDRKAFHPVLCCLKRDGGPMEPEFRAAGVPLYTGIQKSPFDALGIIRLARIMRREGISILDTDLQRNTVLIATLAAALARVPGAVISVHATAPVGRKRLIQRTVRLCLGRIDRIIALADVHRDLLVDEEGMDPDKTIVLWNGVSVEDFRPGPPPGNLRNQLGVPEGGSVVGIVASLFSDKGHEVFLKASAQVLGRHPNTVFLVIGEGPERESLEKTAKEMGLERSVFFLGRRRDLPELLRLIDISVLSSYPYRETFPISILEAMATGNPTVTTRVGALSDIVDEGETGYLVEIGDAGGLAEAMIRLLDDPERRARMGMAARKRTEDLFDIRKIVRRREAMYRQLLSAKGRMGEWANGQ